MIKPKSNSGNSIAWFLPRLHHNYIEWINLLAKEKDARSTVYVAVGSTNEQRENSAEEVQLNESRLSEWLGRKFGYGGANKRRFLASSSHLWQIFSMREHSTVVIRDPSRLLSLQVLVFCLVFRIRNVILYSQTAKIYQDKISIKLLRQSLKLLGFRYVSTVMPPVGGRDDYHTSFVPFIFEGMTSPSDYGSLRILTISKFQKRKRLIEFLYQLEGMINANPELSYEWTVVGEVHNEAQEQYYEEFRKLAKEMGLERQVKIKKNLNKAEIVCEYQWCNLFVLASHQEPAAYCVIEALAQARPVFCDVSNGTKGYLLEPRYGHVFSDIQTLNVTITQMWRSGQLEKMHINLLNDCVQSNLLGERRTQVVSAFGGKQ